MIRLAVPVAAILSLPVAAWGSSTEWTNQWTDGDWTIATGISNWDDQPAMAAWTFSKAGKSVRGDYFPALSYSCSESRPSVVFTILQRLIMPEEGRFSVGYRIDRGPVVYGDWVPRFDMDGAGIWDEPAIDFMRAFYDAQEQVVLRLTEADGRKHTHSFSLYGGRAAVRANADACGWNLEGDSP